MGTVNLSPNSKVAGLWNVSLFHLKLEFNDVSDTFPIPAQPITCGEYSQK